MKPAQYERNGHTIKTLSLEGKRNPFSSINAAKRESRKLQMELDRGLGRGSVIVAKN